MERYELALRKRKAWKIMQNHASDFDQCISHVYHMYIYSWNFNSYSTSEDNIRVTSI